MKKPVSATIDEDLIEWMDSEIEKGKRFRNRSHLIEYAIESMKGEEKKEGKK